VFFTQVEHAKAMKLMPLFFLVVLLISAASQASKVLALKLVATIENKIVTSRDVEANYLVDHALYNNKQISQLTIGSDDFSEALNRLLVEMMVNEEAAFFEVAKVTENETDEALKGVKTRIQENPATKSRWGHLSYNDSQMKNLVERKLRANRFIKYKSNSSYVEPTEEEARDYFKKNRLKFGTMEFDQFKSNIKKYLGTKSAEERLRDWFDVLRKKHKVKNFMTGSINYDFSSTPHK
jgi:hypothetical protein